ncbi:hypothetical protein PsorP6_006373 [Peronosclerospora sorghi]|uniref:Uncharacterized protein n=1 Tax=Peronosclerospora sorghi TaxID=230839 RepID=A0ACC0W318_9STRA|nr:hypothetical protein PsorP6_006373 [Peronosclerospora sorghi]
MASPSDHEDGEIVEERDALTQRSYSLQAGASSSTLSCAAVSEISVALPSIPPPNDSVRPIAPKRHLSSLEASDGSSPFDKRMPLAHRPPVRAHRRPGREYEQPDDRVYYADLIVKHPRQEPRSHVLLDFATWMAGAPIRKRLDVEDVQELVLNVLQGGRTKEKGRISPYLLPSLMPGAELPTRVCLVLVANLHPSIVQKFRAKLNFLDACSSVPVTLTKASSRRSRKAETPLPELLYKFARPSVETHDLSTEELFYAHELTFLMKHSAGYTDEVVLLPAGTFTRKSQPFGGTWKLDGDLLHLKWRHRTAKGATESTTDQDEEDDADAYTLDVLVSQDASMHEFRTDAVTDETYARKGAEPCAKRRRCEDKPRSMWLSLARAIAVDVPRSVDGTLLRSEQAPKSKVWQKSEDTSSCDAVKQKDLTREAFEYYLVSYEERKLHGYPMDVEEEQRELLRATDGNSRDSYVTTKPRPRLDGNHPVSNDEEGAATETDETVATAGSTEDTFLYALDCEMCETDIGMELTRVTLVDRHGKVVYDELVKPQSSIINYHTAFSGISKATLEQTTYLVADVQRDLTTRFLFQDTILVGHSLTSDLRALRLIHPTIADTAILFPHERGFPYRTSLKTLTKTYLKRDIQMQVETGHDSAEDALASLELLLLKVRHGPWFGLPPIVSTTSAFDSMVDKLVACDKKMTMVHVETDARETNGKPWERYANGELHAQAQSSIRHAKAVKQKPQAASARATVDIHECVSWHELEANKLPAVWTDKSEEPDLWWIELEPPCASAAECHDFIRHHDRYIAAQETYCAQVDTFLQNLFDHVLRQGTLLLALPQGDLNLVRYLKALRTRAKWRDATSGTDELGLDELHAAVGDALSGALDSCLFLRQKRQGA